jgi:lysophospholipid acyltransferase (LPLAT)-like uncharacterized protein
MSLKKSKQGVLRFLGHHFLYYILTILCKSLKIVRQNNRVIETLNKNNQNYVLAFWHGTMLLPWYLHGSKYKVIRGSSSTGSDVALGIMVDYAKNRYSVAITPDGPRGPRHNFKAGAVVTAKKTGIPLILAGVGFKRKKFLSNWDKFEIPYFFTTAKIVYSDPFYVNRKLTFEETSAVISSCNAELNKLQEQAQNFS